MVMVDGKECYPSEKLIVAECERDSLSRKLGVRQADDTIEE